MITPRILISLYRSHVTVLLFFLIFDPIEARHVCKLPFMCCRGLSFLAFSFSCLSRLVVSCLVLSCLVVSCLVVSCLVLSFLDLSRLFCLIFVLFSLFSGRSFRQRTTQPTTRRTQHEESLALFPSSLIIYLPSVCLQLPCVLWCLLVL